MIHLYTAKQGRWRAAPQEVQYKLLCTNQYVSGGGSDSFLTVPGRITCPACLDILIPKQEALLERMKETRRRL